MLLLQLQSAAPMRAMAVGPVLMMMIQRRSGMPMTMDFHASRRQSVGQEVEAFHQGMIIKGAPYLWCRRWMD